MRPAEVVRCLLQLGDPLRQAVPLVLKLAKRGTRGLCLGSRGLKLRATAAEAVSAACNACRSPSCSAASRIGPACGLVARLLQPRELPGQHITLGLGVAQARPGRCRVRTRRFQLAGQPGRARHGALELSGQRIALGAKRGPLLGQRLRLALDLAQPRSNGLTLAIARRRRIARLAGGRLGRAQLAAQILDEPCQLVALCRQLLDLRGARLARLLKAGDLLAQFVSLGAQRRRVSLCGLQLARERGGVRLDAGSRPASPSRSAATASARSAMPVRSASIAATCSLSRSRSLCNAAALALAVSSCDLRSATLLLAAASSVEKASARSATPVRSASIAATCSLSWSRSPRNAATVVCADCSCAASSVPFVSAASSLAASALRSSLSDARCPASAADRARARRAASRGSAARSRWLRRRPVLRRWRSGRGPAGCAAWPRRRRGSPARPRRSRPARRGAAILPSAARSWSSVPSPALAPGLRSRSRAAVSERCASRPRTLSASSCSFCSRRLWSVATSAVCRCKRCHALGQRVALVDERAELVRLPLLLVRDLLGARPIELDLAARAGPRGAHLLERGLALGELGAQIVDRATLCRTALRLRQRLSRGGELGATGFDLLARERPRVPRTRRARRRSGRAHRWPRRPPRSVPARATLAGRSPQSRCRPAR